MSTSTSTERFIPARLSFLAIYNPSIAPRDETLEEQVVFCYSRKRHRARLKRRKSNVTITTEAAVDAQRNEQNEMLRQIGLAQGMVEFAKTFSNGQPVDSIETDKTRIVLLELERGWWIYVSIDLTRFPRSAISNSSPQYEYSAREVSTPILLRQQLFHAHSIFLLHHGRCLDGLYSKLGREKFCSVLDGFWTRFARTWDVLLHGNPAVEALRGIKLAAGGELGIGVGEEEWGSGEREVLEGFVRRTDGLVDLMVSRFGVDDIRKARMEREDIEDDRDAHVAATDGVVFTGVGALTRSSSRAVAGWVEWLHLDGVRAYGVDENPKSTGRRRREGSKSRTEAAAGKMNGGGSLRPKAAHKSSTSQLRTPETDTRSRNHTGTPSTSTRDSKTRQSISEKATENHPVEKSGSKLMKYMTLGYGSSWGGTPKTAEVGIDGAGTGDSNMAQTTPRAANRRGHSEGFFLIGLRGDLNEQPEKEESNDDDGNSHSSPKMDSGHDSDVENDEQRHDRIMLRTVHVHLNKPYNDHQTESNERFRTLQVVVYQNSPFCFVFLFEPQTPSLAMPSFYRSLHQLFSPLQTPLRSSTSPSRANERVHPLLIPYLGQHNSSAEPGGKKKINTQPTYSVVFDPIDLTIHSSIPMIPDPSISTFADRLQDDRDEPRKVWSRIDALNIHLQILEMTSSNQDRTKNTNGRQKTRTIKKAMGKGKGGEITSRTTSRGWWISLFHPSSSSISTIEDAQHHHPHPQQEQLSSSLISEDEDGATSFSQTEPTESDHDIEEDEKQRQETTIILIQKSPLPSASSSHNKNITSIEDENTLINFPSFWHHHHHRDITTTNPDSSPRQLQPPSIMTPSRTVNPHATETQGHEEENGNRNASLRLPRPTRTILPTNIPLDLGLGSGMENSRRYIESLFK